MIPAAPPVRSVRSEAVFLEKNTASAPKDVKENIRSDARNACKTGCSEKKNCIGEASAARFLRAVTPSYAPSSFSRSRSLGYARGAAPASRRRGRIKTGRTHSRPPRLPYFPPSLVKAEARLSKIGSRLLRGIG